MGGASRLQREHAIGAEAVERNEHRVKQTRFVALAVRYLRAGSGIRVALEPRLRAAAMELDASEVPDLIIEAQRRASEQPCLD
jgi:hypothetical protein